MFRSKIELTYVVKWTVSESYAGGGAALTSPISPETFYCSPVESTFIIKQLSLLNTRMLYELAFRTFFFY